jgi:hypothetical protein
MFCPACGSEYRDGFVRCADCDVDLVANLPSAPGDDRSKIELVEVFETGDPIVMSVVESLLQETGIEFSTSSETATNLYIGGRLGGSFSFGPRKYFVRNEDEAAARDIVANLRDIVANLSEEATPPE